MGHAREPAPVKLVASLLSQDTAVLAEAVAALELRWGPVDWVSELLPFEHTEYYAAEFGTHLQRRFVTFRHLIAPAELPAAKRHSNEIEWVLARDGRRRVNIDPGYVSLAKLVLATTKDHAHRVYLGDGIYAEVTLVYQNGCFRPWPWTYPDYAEEGCRALFSQVRERYRRELRRVDGLQG